MIVINFSEFLKEKRNEKNMSMRELERKTGLSQSYISQVESGNRTTPKPETLKRIADGLDISYESLMLAAGYVHTNSLAEAFGLNEDEIIEVKNGELVAKSIDDLKSVEINLDHVLKDQNTDIYYKNYKLTIEDKEFLSTLLDRTFNENN